MAQLGQILTDLLYYEKHLNDPAISNVGHSGQYSDLINAPTNVSQFNNDVPYSTPGGNVSLFANDKQYAVPGSSVGQFLNDQQYVVSGDNVSQFHNDVPYVTQLQLSSLPPSRASFGGTAVVGGGANYTIQQMNIGLACFNDGLDSHGTNMTVNHGLPARASNQTYIGFAQAFCPASGVDAGIIATIFYVNATHLK